MATAYEKDQSYDGTRYGVNGSLLFRRFVLVVDDPADDPGTAFATATGGFPMYTSHPKVAGYYAADGYPETTDDPLTYYFTVVYQPSILIPNIEWEIEYGWAYETVKRYQTDDGVTIGPHTYLLASEIDAIRERRDRDPTSLTDEENAKLAAVYGMTADWHTVVEGVVQYLYQVGGDAGRRAIGLDVPKELYQITFRARTSLLGRAQSPRSICLAAYKVNSTSFMDWEPRTVMLQPPRIRRSVGTIELQPTQGVFFDIELPFLVNVGGWVDRIYDLWADDNGDTTFIIGESTEENPTGRVYTDYLRGAEIDFNAFVSSILPPGSGKIPGGDGKGGGR